jgi:ferredoxin-thioredoxin reductase catalytic subunit
MVQPTGDGPEPPAELLDKIRAQVTKVAAARKWRLNPDDVMVEEVIRGLAHNELTAGRRYCPCRLELVAENICPCRAAASDIARDGHCYCMLFYK